MGNSFNRSKVVTLKKSENKDEFFLKKWDEISPHFRPDEIFSPDTIEKGRHLIDLESLSKLNRFREYVNDTLYVNHAGLTLRGVRSPREQIKLQADIPGAAELSLHVCGKAFDISSPELSVYQLADAAKAFGYTGIGIYKKKNFVHIDTRPLFGGNPVVWSL